MPSRGYRAPAKVLTKPRLAGLCYPTSSTDPQSDFMSKWKIHETSSYLKPLCVLGLTAQFSPLCKELLIVFCRQHDAFSKRSTRHVCPGSCACLRTTWMTPG